MAFCRIPLGSIVEQLQIPRRKDVAEKKKFELFSYYYCNYDHYCINLNKRTIKQRRILLILIIKITIQHYDGFTIIYKNKAIKKYFALAVSTHLEIATIHVSWQPVVGDNK